MKYSKIVLIAALMAASGEAHRLIQRSQDEVDDLLEKQD